MPVGYLNAARRLDCVLAFIPTAAGGKFLAMSALPYEFRRLFPRMSRRRCLIYLALVFVGYLRYSIYRIPKSIREAYALGWVSGMVVEYMERNDGRWPREWDDLKGPYETGVAAVGRPWSFDDLRSRVDVDFSANPKELAKARFRNGSVPFRVISLRSGYYHYWEGSEPNVRVWEYLQKRAKVAATAPHHGNQK
jgi:hypothetical protein